MKARKYIEFLEGDILDFKKNGVYYLRHLDRPNKIYIGSSYRPNNKRGRIGIYYRFLEHLSRLKNNNHHSFYLQNVCNKYGIDNLRCGIVDIDDITPINIIEKEQFYIDKYKSYDSNFGFNMSKSAFGASPSEEQRLQSSIRMTKNNPMKNPDIVKKMADSMRKNSLVLLQYSISGEFINEYRGIETAAKAVNTDPSNIFRAAVGQTKSSADYIWFYKNDFTEDLLIEKVKIYNTSYKPSKETVEKRSILQRKKISKFNLNNVIIETYDSVKEAAEKNNLYSGNISRAAQGIYKTCGGFIWKYDK